VNYCIATGWCNPWLTTCQAFPRLERAISSLTGMVPRADEDAFAWGQAVNRESGSGRES
jgi:hypothetical protein